MLAGALNLDAGDWIEQSDGVWFRPLLLGVSSGFYVNLLKVRVHGVLSRHRHHGPVHALTLRGQWRYLEHDWVASPGDYVYESTGETHTLVVSEQVSEMITLFHVTGAYSYLDAAGRVTGYEDVFTKLKRAQHHYQGRETELHRLLR
jgi:quercetin dioxygenase-like cupin family protein